VCRFSNAAVVSGRGPKARAVIGLRQGNEAITTEQLILVDTQDREVSVKEKLQTHIEGALPMVCSVFVFDAKRCLLLQTTCGSIFF
jgi:hypothetical protein